MDSEREKALDELAWIFAQAALRRLIEEQSQPKGADHEHALEPQMNHKAVES